MSNVWVDIDITQWPFLQPLQQYSADSLSAYVAAEDADNLRRTSADGTWLLRTRGAQQDVAIVWSDFRVNGASFGSAVSRRIAAFLGECSRRGLPLILVMNSLGYRFMEGRAAFNDVFNLIPAFDAYSNDQLMITICHGQCLGLGAILFGMGQYRIGVQKDSALSLTGPEVFRLFFGSKIDFSAFSSIDEQYLKTSLVHTRAPDLEDALRQAHDLVSMTRMPGQMPLPPVQPEADHAHGDFLGRQRYRIQAACQQLLQPVADRYVELFSQFDTRLRVYLVFSDGLLFGLVMNPPENPNNMITVRTLKLYQDALALFRMLRLPLVSFLDTPGVDPRIDSSNQDIIQQLIATNRAIIAYPHAKMGVWTGRGFGGANTLVIPSIYGSVANYVILERTTVGVMHESIIAHLLEKSRRLLAVWRQSRVTEAADFQDLVEAGIVTRAIHLHELRQVILASLRGQFENDRNESTPVNSSGGDLRQA